MLLVTSTLTTFGLARPVSAIETDDEAQFLTLVNALRQDLGLAPLAVHLELIPPSRAWAGQLAANGELSHAPDLSVGVTATWSMLGENVGVASIGQTQELFDAFVASPGHYENLVNPKFEYIGIGVVYDAGGRMWTTHRFMALATTPAPTAPPQTTVPPNTVPPNTVTPTTPPTTTPTAPTTSLGDVAGEAPPRLANTGAAALAPDVISAVLRDLADSGV